MVKSKGGLNWVNSIVWMLISSFWPRTLVIENVIIGWRALGQSLYFVCNCINLNVFQMKHLKIHLKFHTQLFNSLWVTNLCRYDFANSCFCFVFLVLWWPHVFCGFWQYTNLIKLFTVRIFWDLFWGWFSSSFEVFILHR